MRVSVVIPTYNYAHTVGEAVASALAQTRPPLEVIVVDDGSTDDTPARLAAFGDAIRVVRQANAGLSAARNAGIRAARGEWVALLDSDDAFHPRKLELQADYLAADPSVRLLGTGQFSDPAARWPAVADAPPGRRVTVDELVVRSRFAPSSVLFRRDVCDAVGYFDPALRSVEDRDFWIRAACRVPVAVLDAPLAFYREQPGSMSRNPDKMEHFERVVIDKAFALPELAGRRLLRRKAVGLALASAAFEQWNVGRRGPAARRMARSFGWWPLPLGRPDVKVPFARLRLLAAIARNRRPAPGPTP
jgi:glycosyltransferase involved in cell wall biosynthesis